MTRQASAFAAVFFLITSISRSHDIGLWASVEGEHHPELFHGSVGSLLEFERIDGEDIFTLSPAMVMGLHEYVSLSLSGHFTDETGNFDFESVLPALQFHCHPAGEAVPFHIHAQIGYQFANGGTGEAEDTGGHGHGEEQEHENEQDHEHEAEHGNEHAFRSAVHSHGLSLLTGRIEADYCIGRTLLGAGVIGTRFEDGDTGFGYTARVLQCLTPSLHAGAEAFGDFDSDGYHEVSATIYYRLWDRIQVSGAIAFGLTDEAPDRVVRLGVSCKF